MILRQLCLKDTDGMLEWMKNPHNQKGLQRDFSKMTENDVINFIKKSWELFENGSARHYAITDDEDTYLGTISLKDIDLESKKAEYAISLREMAKGTGVSVLATKRLLEIAFKELNLNRVYLYVLTDNERAIRLYQKCGFVYEGTLRDHIYIDGKFKSLACYGILRDEYMKVEKWID